MIFSQRELGCFLLCTTTVEYFNGKMSSIASLKKVIQFAAEILILAIFGYLGPYSKSIYSMYRQNFKKSSVCFFGKVVRNVILKFEFSIFKKVRGAG